MVITSRITLIVLVYNNEAFVKRTLLSILENDTEYFDVVINDDCSTDNSLLVVEQFLKEHKGRTKQWRVHVNSVNIGINSSIKNILETCKNEWVKYIAGDDEFAPGSLAEYWKLAHTNNARSGIVLSGMILIDKESEIIGKRKSLSNFFYENDWLKTTNFYINTINAPTVMIGRENLLSALYGTKVKNAEDWAVLRFCISNKIDFIVCNELLIRYRLHASSLSASYHGKKISGGVKNIISDQVEVLLRENAMESSSWAVRLGIYLQIRQLNARSELERNFFKVLKLANPQFCIFKALEMISRLEK